MQPIAFDGFDWNRGNLALVSGAMLILPDAKHSDEEVRLIATGVAADGRHVFVVFTLRAKAGLTLLRPVSARYMHKREILRYEQARAAIAK